MDELLLKLSYKNKSIEKVCNSEKKATREYGAIVAEKLMLALDASKAAASLDEIRPLRYFRLHQLQGNRSGTFAMDLGKTTGFRLIIMPVDLDGKMIKITKIDNYKETKAVEIEEVSKHYE